MKPLLYRLAAIAIGFFLGAALCGLISLLCGCAQTRYIPITSDTSTSTSQHVEIRQRIDTVFVPLPAESQAVTTRDTASTLRTSIAESFAAILPDGSLRHELHNLRAAFPATVTARDTIIAVADTVRINRDVPVPVPAQLTAWQRFRLRWFGILAAIALALAAITFRRPILRLLRRIIK